MEIIHDAIEQPSRPLIDTDSRCGLIFNGYLEDRRTIILAQPTEWSRAGIDTAARALDTLRRALTVLGPASDLSTGDRLRRAFATANADLAEQARDQSGHDPDGIIGVGATIVQVDGEIATIGLVPPAQLLLWQDGRPTWCPARESWTGQQPGLTGAPLGWSAEPHATVVATAVNGRDEVVLTTDVVARLLAKGPEADFRSTEALCARIGVLGTTDDTDSMPLIAVSTRLMAPTLTDSLLGVTRQTLTQLEGRVKSAWTALRAPG